MRPGVTKEHGHSVLNFVGNHRRATESWFGLLLRVGTNKPAAGLYRHAAVTA